MYVIYNVKTLMESLKTESTQFDCYLNSHITSYLFRCEKTREAFLLNIRD